MHLEREREREREKGRNEERPEFKRRRWKRAAERETSTNERAEKRKQTTSGRVPIFGNRFEMVSRPFSPRECPTKEQIKLYSAKIQALSLVSATPAPDILRGKRIPGRLVFGGIPRSQWRDAACFAAHKAGNTHDSPLVRNRAAFHPIGSLQPSALWDARYMLSKAQCVTTGSPAADNGCALQPCCPFRQWHTIRFRNRCN